MARWDAGNFDYDCSIREIEKLMEKYGTVKNIDMKTGAAPALPLPPVEHAHAPAERHPPRGALLEAVRCARQALDCSAIRQPGFAVPVNGRISRNQFNSVTTPADHQTCSVFPNSKP